ncbi:hypothetical protein [Planctomicrobium piriforme]|uniref:Uncharacterized protein n=1 Tax=Planctomicrobium piriforme TaxID=1576369 RepID=A0A1I3EF99_9PLAN|nr:hypothetical protein [Planctomicrobium piriforme]SFH97638.1 hypothetical protein SAMN05421753_104198 [Planctomicrobium piriforme]
MPKKIWEPQAISVAVKLHEVLATIELLEPKARQHMVALLDKISDAAPPVYIHEKYDPPLGIRWSKQERLICKAMSEIVKDPRSRT